MDHTGRRRRIVAAALIGLLLLLLLLVAAFPWGWLRPLVEREASRRFGRPVTIGSVERTDYFGFRPLIAVRDLRIPQADWAGPGDFVKIDRLQFRLPIWTMLRGGVRPQDIVASGVALSFARDKAGRTNWQSPDASEAKGGEQDSGTDMGTLTVRDAVIRYADAKRDRTARFTLTADPVTGLRAQGTGTVAGAPVRLALSGPAPTSGQPWPFTARIEGDRLAMTATGRMDRPLDPARMDIAVTARGDDLKRIDTVIEAGLFHTRPVTLKARVRHDPDRWVVTGLTGTIGRSDLTGHVTVDKVDGRSKIDGAFTSKAFDFNDLTSAKGRAEAAALEARIGPRLVPNTRIDIGKIDSTDGRLAFKVGRIVGSSSPPVEGLAGVLTLDHRLLTLAPLRLDLAQGRITGRAVVDQRRGQPAPTLTLDLNLAGGDVGAFAAGGAFTGKLAARVRLTGTGETIRAAVGRSSGTIGFTVRQGQLPARYAAALGFDAGRALLAGSDDHSALRCLVTRLTMQGGTARPDPLVIDTAVSQLRGDGTIHFPDERLALTLHGAPKGSALLRIPGQAYLRGTIQNPQLTVPPEVRSAGNILKAIGRKITGHNGPTATDADCASLSARALR